MPINPKQIIASVPFTDPQNNLLANGSITFDLSAPAAVVTNGGQVVPTRVSVVLTGSANIPAVTSIWANDQITPSGTVYQVNIFNSNGLHVEGPVFWSLTGTSPIDLSGMIPVATSTLSFSLPGLTAQSFSTNGTFTIPATVTKLKVTALGAGGAGGGSNGANAGAGGGGGGMAISYLTGLTPGNTLLVTIGVGGTGVSAATGNSGTATTVASGTQIIATITGNGGVGGLPNSGGTGGAIGGTATGGNLFNVAGTAGGSVYVPGVGPAGASSLYGAGGSAAINAVGNPGLGFGTGGGGAQGTGPFAGGNGTPGMVLFEWVA